MLKKVSKILLSLTLALVVTATPIMAGNVSYSYTVNNTGQRYTKITAQTNQKIHAGEPWVNNVTGITFTDAKAYTSATLGMAYIPLTSDLYAAGAPQWRKGTGLLDGSWGGYSGAKGYYHLGARIDDLLSGSGSASGRWNSDKT